ncbi:AbrB/MazE/SpoVT family DNA-binding domain-containing protein [Alkalibacterium pelagium]|uniref:Antitoxin MazE n=1 Tax=Alkalibacterium pelagium TaxID=426702 RepID=A0A1H7JVX3_9LACT|nr:AbrB/MazE/SpoVT family DNA-binding domain-containing protein [Alkalibacterium pelagium]GEN50527.1 multidrug transporter MatE [Alkalibacterium pelagium]SEK78719.1 antitoxin MazE [Alkalibacterium pelagium]
MSSDNKIEKQTKRWGNSIGLRIPKEMATELNLEEESAVYLQVKDGKLIIEPKKDLSLEEMVDLINEDNRQDLIDLVEPVGRELF